MSVLEFDDSQGHAPPLHIHDNEDEVWIVLDGEIIWRMPAWALGPGPGPGPAT